MDFSRSKFIQEARLHLPARIDDDDDDMDMRALYATTR
jgi:hypothetical protein